MTECKYCHKDILEGQDLADPDIHSVCWDERIKRYNTYKCTLCGINETHYMTERPCAECVRNNADYSGYK